MPQIKDKEVLTPLRGVCDTIVKGEGLIDLTGPREGAPEAGSFISLSLEFKDEGAPGKDSTTYAEVHFTNDYGALIEEGVDPEIAGYIVASADLFATALRSLIYRGGKYGAVKK